jgi:hypothetical protein
MPQNVLERKVLAEPVKIPRNLAPYLEDHQMKT